MTGKKAFSIKHFLQISLAVMLLFLLIISTLYSLFIYTFSRDQFESSFQTFSESIEAQLDSQFRNVEHSVTQLSYFSNMQEILFSKKPLVYLNNISGCNQLWGYLKTSLPIITEVIITSPYGHTFYSGTTGKYRYQKFAEKIIQENKNMSREPFFLTIPPGDDSNQLPQLVYCFPVHNTLLSGYISDEYALGMALIDVNTLVGLSSSEKYVGEIKAILYHNNIVYISREASQLEMSALLQQPQDQGKAKGLAACNSQTASPFGCLNNFYFRILSNFLGSLHKFRIGNVEYTCHTVTLENIDMSMIDIVPTANLLQSSAQTRIIATTILLGTCACLIFSTWLIQHYISKPINQMIADMQDIQAGIRKSLTLPNLSDLRYLAESINQTLNVLDIANRRQLEMSHTLYQTTLAQKQAQLNAYKNQISPHFLFNTLESMRSMAHHYQVPILENMLTSLSSLFRYSLRSNLVVSLKEELNHVQHYFNVMDMRSPLRYELRVDISSKALSHSLLSMILQPIVENSITHGFQRKRKPCILFIQGQVNEESGILLLKIADNGIGIPLEKIQEIEQRYFQEGDALHNDHIGLDNVLRRLHLFYGKDFGFSLRSQENHYTVITLYIPNFPSEPSR